MKTYNKDFNSFIRELKIEGAEFVDIDSVIYISEYLGIKPIQHSFAKMTYDIKLNWYKEMTAFILGFNNEHLYKIEYHISMIDRLFYLDLEEYRCSFPKLKLLRSRLIFLRKYLKNRKYMFNSTLTNLNKGLLGEQIITNLLAKRLDTLVLSNITLTDGCSGYCECDSIVISPNGVFCLEVKNYGATGLYRIEIDGTGNWIKINKNGRYLLDNPVTQNDNHVRIVNNILYRKFGYNVTAMGLVVIADKNVSVESQSVVPVCNPSTLNSTMSTYSKTILSQEQIRNIYNYLLEQSTGLNYFNDLNYSLENNNYSNIVSFINMLDLMWTLS